MRARLVPILGLLAPIARAFAESDHRLYLVGGAVRDLFLAEEVSSDDLDLTTDATPPEVLQLLEPLVHSVNRAGEHFGTISCVLGSTRLEITTHRREVYVEDSRKPWVAFSRRIEDDLVRRDFTINAMALEITTREPALIDPYRGLEDLLAHQLRTPVSPEVSFREDPLRMLRAARFIARFQLSPEPGLIEAVAGMAPRFRILSRERIRDELSRLLVVPDPTAGLQFIVATPIAREILPALADLALEQDPIHRHKDVLAHTIAVVAKCSPRLRLRLAALLHDVGKPATRQITPRGVTFHHHELVGARMTKEILTELRYPKELVNDVARLVELHLRFHGYEQGWTDAAVRRYVRDAGPLYDDLNELTLCDATTRNQTKLRAMQERMAGFRRRVDELQAADQLAALRPPLDGTEVMNLLALDPSPAVGEAMRFLRDLAIEEGNLTKEQATAALLTWWEKRHPTD